MTVHGTVYKESCKNVPRLSHASRCLFGRSDPEVDKADMKMLLRRLQDQSNRRWNFDFQTRTPLEGGQLHWVPVILNKPEVNAEDKICHQSTISSTTIPCSDSTENISPVSERAVVNEHQLKLSSTESDPVVSSDRLTDNSTSATDRTTVCKTNEEWNSRLQTTDQKYCRICPQVTEEILNQSKTSPKSQTGTTGVRCLRHSYSSQTSPSNSSQRKRRISGDKISDYFPKQKTARTIPAATKRQLNL